MVNATVGYEAFHLWIVSLVTIKFVWIVSLVTIKDKELTDFCTPKEI